MSTLGSYISLLAGSNVPSPLPPALLETLESLEVHHSDRGRSAFEMTFLVAHGVEGTSTADLAHDSLRSFNRVVISALFEGTLLALIDGFVTLQQSQPAGEPGAFRLTVTGEDVSLEMDLHDRNESFAGLSDANIVRTILGHPRYAALGLTPDVRTPAFSESPSRDDRIPTQNGTDLEFVQELAERHGFVFHVAPGLVPRTNTAYWGPPVRQGEPQKALAVNMGPHTNVESVEFRHDALASHTVDGTVQDRVTNAPSSVRADTPRRDSLAASPLWADETSPLRRVRFREVGHTRGSGNARAQAMVEAAAEEVVTVTGELDAERYGRPLQARSTVQVQGAGAPFNGRYYVKEVRHLLRPGGYRQRFTLIRGGLGSTIERLIR